MVCPATSTVLTNIANAPAVGFLQQLSQVDEEENGSAEYSQLVCKWSQGEQTSATVGRTDHRCGVASMQLGPIVTETFESFDPIVTKLLNLLTLRRKPCG